MAEARRRSQQGLGSRSEKRPDKNNKDSPRIVSWFPVTQFQRDEFIRLTIRGGWVGIGMLVVFWLVVRIIGPAAGWWIPADAR